MMSKRTENEKSRRNQNRTSQTADNKGQVDKKNLGPNRPST
ncbi:hypothetical protein ACM26V_01795 [Salipaludibacillus sp. HK11]